MSDIKLIHGDCMDVMAGYPDNYFDLAIVDPPYGIGESGSTNKTRGKLAKARDYGNKKWDEKSPDNAYFIELMRVSRNQIIWGANHFISKIPFVSSCWIVWDKVNGDTDFADCELAYTSFKTAVRIVRYMWHGFMQGGNFTGGMNGNKKINEARIHPTQKPVALYKWILNKYADTSFKILDTHLGSGSSAIAAKEMGVSEFVGIEIDEEYFNAAMKRFNSMTIQNKLF